jgi:hypothetical protein
MKKMTIDRISAEMKRVLDFAREKVDVVLETPDGEEFVVSWVDDFDIELAQQRGNEKLMAFLDARFKEARSSNGIPLEVAKRELDDPANRRARKPKRPVNGKSHGKVSRRKAGPHSR